MPTESKPALPGFEERRLGPTRYFVAGSGEPVVLVHGLGGFSANWRLIAPPLAAGRRVIVPDLPGHGGSAALPEAPSTLDPFAEAVLGVLEHEGALPAPWIGHSFGGTVGLRAAVRRPEAVQGLLLAAAAGISSASRAAEALLSVIGFVEPGRRIAPYRRRIARSRLGRTFAFGWWGVADPAGFPPAMAEAFLAGPGEHENTLQAGKALVQSDPRRDLDRVACPCVCVWGASDNWVPLRDGMEYARRLRAPLRVIADCGHLLIGERPEAVLDAVWDLLERVSPGATG